MVLISSELEELVEGATRVFVLRDGAVVGSLTGDAISEHRIMTTIAAAAREDDAGGAPPIHRRRWRVTEPVIGTAPRSRVPDGDPPIATRRARTPSSGRCATTASTWRSALLLLFNLLFTPNFATVGNLRLQLVQVVPIAIVALGMALVVATEGIDLSVGSVMAITAAVIPLYLGYGPWVAVAVGIAAGVVVGALNGTMVAVFGIQPIIATLGVLVAGRAVALVLADGRLVEIFDPTLQSLGNGTVAGIPVTVLIVAALSVVVGVAVRWFVFGRRLVAIGGNRTAARLAGLPVRRTLIVVYIACGVLAALAGVVNTARLGRQRSRRSSAC